MKQSSTIHSVVSYATSILLMAFISFLSLLVLSLLTYLFKWQAPQAMVGIILTYILAGFGGGLLWSNKANKVYTSYISRIIRDSLISGSGYIGLLAICFLCVRERLQKSIQAPLQMGNQIDVPRIASVWLLVVAAYAIGAILRRNPGKNR